jgi:voltage-gated sodium channel
MIAKLSQILANPWTERTVIALILLNAITLGLETSPAIMAAYGPILLTLDKIILVIFACEIVVIALLPASGALSVLRALRVLRVLRLITVLPSLKRVVGALVGALPGMGSIALLLLLFLYVSAVMATKLFSAGHPELFGDMGKSTYTLVQLMTLDGWSAEIVGPVMKTHPYSWLFFLPFVLATAFTVLNLFIGIVVSAMQSEHEKAREEDNRAENQAQQAEQRSLLSEVRALRTEVAELKAALPAKP